MTTQAKSDKGQNAHRLDTYGWNTLKCRTINVAEARNAAAGVGLCLSSCDHARLVVQGSSSSGLLSLAQPHSLVWLGSRSGQANTRDRNIELNILTHLRKVTVESQAVSWMRPMHRVL